jgi:3-hydroxyisobutyrate dehydrogenase-like beta-hydroxyacid dehydrogenase
MNRQNQMTTVGFVGLGRIGRPIAANIQAVGFNLMVFDVRGEPMAELARLGTKRNVKEPPLLSRIFDFSITRKVITEVQGTGWQPGL